MNDVIEGPWKPRPATFICPHETPGGPQRCALCRREVERLHDPTGRYTPEPYWKQQGRRAQREAVPMPDHVRRLADELRQGRQRPPAGEQGELL